MSARHRHLKRRRWLLHLGFQVLSSALDRVRREHEDTKRIALSFGPKKPVAVTTVSGGVSAFGFVVDTATAEAWCEQQEKMLAKALVGPLPPGPALLSIARRVDADTGLAVLVYGYEDGSVRTELCPG